MADFKPGDRVRVFRNRSDHDHVGRVGVVCFVDHGLAMVALDCPPGFRVARMRSFFISELELIPELTELEQVLLDA